MSPTVPPDFDDDNVDTFGHSFEAALNFVGLRAG